MTQGVQPRPADQPRRKPVRFSVCTLVTSHPEYADMVRSFREGGFDGSDCEYLYLDNSKGNVFDAFQGTNIFLQEACGEFIILCHQDVVLLEDGRRELEKRLFELDVLDPSWALCGNAGGTVSGELVMRISDPHGTDRTRGILPSKVTALDENFMVVRRSANLCVSHDLAGFHLYGADLSIIADILGRSAWVIDFHLRHKSGGRYEPAFFATVKSVKNKYRRAFRRREIITTCTEIMLSGSWFQQLLDRLLRR